MFRLRDRLRVTRLDDEDACVDRRKTYREILTQALAKREDVSVDEIEFSEIADGLADDLYRLCVEFGVQWNDFKQDTLAIAVGPEGSSDDAPAADDGRLDDVVGTHLPLVIMALELMPDDNTL